MKQTLALAKINTSMALQLLEKEKELEQVVTAEVVSPTEQTEVSVDTLKKLGLSQAANKLDSVRKMQKAYLKYLFVSMEKINKFNEKLRIESREQYNSTYRYKSLIFIPLAQYSELPPPHVLSALESAMQDNIFDTYEIAKIQWIEEVKDPILFGTINGCTDKFFISQWDDDVKVEDLIFMD